MNEQEDTNARTEKELAELQTLSAGKIREHIAELNESETVYRFMFENNPLPMYVVDFATLQFLFVNEAAIALYGYSKEEFFAMTVADIRLPDEVENLQNEAKSISKTYYYGDARRHKKKNGDIIWVEIATMGFLYNGKKSAIVLINDVTKRKLDEEILRDSEAQFRKLTELS
ncbi:MAG: PAS domain S-box protein, partial [Bacteroidota bacterium]